MGAYMGRLPIVGQLPADFDDDPEHPSETHDEGCPGGWYRCDFALSVLDHEPLRIEGAYAPCPALDECDDELIYQAVRYLQIERSKHNAYWTDLKLR